MISVVFLIPFLAFFGCEKDDGIKEVSVSSFSDGELIISNESGFQIVRIVDYLNGASIIIRMSDGTAINLSCDKDFIEMQEIAILKPGLTAGKTRSILVNKEGGVEVNKYE